MAQDTHVYDEIDNKTDLREVFKDIRKDVNNAKDRPALTELYRRAGYLITLSYAPSWREKFRGELTAIRQTAEEEFAKTAREINRRAKKVGTDADYDEEWGNKS